MKGKIFSRDKSENRKLKLWVFRFITFWFKNHRVFAWSEKLVRASRSKKFPRDQHFHIVFGCCYCFFLIT